MPNKVQTIFPDHLLGQRRWYSIGLFLVISSVWFAGLQAAVTPPPKPVALRSQSGQFIVHGMPLGAPPAPNNLSNHVSYIRVDPSLLAVSCERIKQALLNQLDMSDQWKGVISVWLHPVANFDEPIDIVSERHPDGWSYRVHMPDQVDRSRAIKAIVQVVLQEMANRRAKLRSAELPPWLVEGISGNLQATSLSTLTLEPETFVFKERARNPDALARIRALLRARPPLTLNELNWPTDEQMTGPNAEVYSACAQFFVFELVRLKNGRNSLGNMLLALPNYHNWQTAFLQAFQGHFQRLLDVDKWWTLNVVHLTSRDMMFTWTREQAFQQLDEALAVSAHVRLNAKELPMPAQVKLQQMLIEWPLWRQTPLLLQKINALQNLRMRAPQELMQLADHYRETLESYLKARRDSGEGPFNPHPLSSDKAIVRETVRKLDGLDAQRDSLRPTVQNTNAAVSNPLSFAPGDPEERNWALLQAQQEALRQSMQNTNMVAPYPHSVPPAKRIVPPSSRERRPTGKAADEAALKETIKRLERQEAQREALRQSLQTNTPPLPNHLSGNP